MRNFLTAITVCAAACAGVWLATSCNTTGCTENRSSVPLAAFCSSADGEPVPLASLQIHGVGAPGDSLILTAGTPVNEVYLPLRPDFQATSFCIAYKYKDLDNAALNDTITIDYNAHPWFADSECGAMYRYTITGCRNTGHIIDSVAVSDPNVTNIGLTNLKLYFVVSTDTPS